MSLAIWNLSVHIYVCMLDHFKYRPKIKESARSIDNHTRFYISRLYDNKTFVLYAQSLIDKHRIFILLLLKYYTYIISSEGVRANTHAKRT